ncbi:MAG: hypothetical protein QNJ68_08500 [Microcoleaceae cyanobacterium MO_207.B10]|nr:hypothetical protein [Microcoleaceae cyanobacterium MO_207.B10]
MKTSVVCRHCRYYSPEGRRGGVCQKLMTPVESDWKACSLALPPFEVTWKNLDGMVTWKQKINNLEVVLPRKSTVDNFTKLPEQVLVGTQE